LPGKRRSTILRALDVAISAKRQHLVLQFTNKWDTAYYIISSVINKVSPKDIEQEICNGI